MGILDNFEVSELVHVTMRQKKLCEKAGVEKKKQQDEGAFQKQADGQMP